MAPHYQDITVALFLLSAVLGGIYFQTYGKNNHQSSMCLKKVFLRSCINHGCLTIDQAENLLASLSESCGVPKPTNFYEFVKEINETIREFNQKLEFFKYPLADGKEFLVFAFTFETEVSKLQMHYSDADRHYFMKLMTACVTNKDFGISWRNIYDVVDDAAAADKKLTKQRMQELVQIWIKQGYFFEKGEIIYLGPRMLVEYGTHLKINYSEFIENCPLCKTLVLWDVECGECGKKVHRDCIRKYLIRKSNCPSCNKTWNTRLSLSN